MARGRFELPPSVKRARARYRQTLDTVRAFITEQCYFDCEGWVDRAELYRHYKDWCRDGGRFPLANSTFNDHLVRAYEARIALRKHHGRPGWLGLALGVDPTPTHTAE